MCYQQAKYIDIWLEFCVLSKECILDYKQSVKITQGPRFCRSFW